MADQNSGRLAVAVREPIDARPAPPPGRPPGGERRTPRFWQVRNWRVRWRVLALVLIPTVAALVLGGVRIQSARDTSSAAAQTGQLGAIGSDLTKLTESLEDERDLTAGYVATAENGGSASQVKSLLAEVHAQQQTTDGLIKTVNADIGQVNGSFPSAAVQDLQAVQQSLGAVAELRTLAGTAPGSPAPGTKGASQMSALPLVIRYSNLVATLLEFDNDIAAGSSNAQLAQTVISFSALAQVQEDASQQRALIFAALASGGFETGALSQVTSAQSSENSVEATYQKVSATLPSYTTATGLNPNLTQAQQFNNLDTGPLIDLATQTENDAIQAADLNEPLSILTSTAQNNSQNNTAQEVQNNTPQAWFTNMSFTLTQMRQVEADELSSISVQATAAQAGAQNSAQLTLVIVAILILLVLIVTIVMARSMIIPLRRLRADALDVAGRRLPAMVQRLSQAEVGENVQIEPIGVDSTDEIGEVARAFDQVHGEAVRLAAEEAMLRANLNAMFVNLSRRSQSLIERQLGIIEGLEQSEQDSDRLSNLFRLDHLATRMRRNSENLLVLAGHEAPRMWTKPVPLVDVLRAAVSEIEQYERISLNVQSRLVIAGRAASDVVHLVAELAENATTFSREETQVRVTGQQLSSGGVLVEITDEGLGIPEQELAHANWRLDNPPVIDVAVSRRMGLFVVGRLAARHGIRVRLRHTGGGSGLSALIWVPDTVAETEPQEAPLNGVRRRSSTAGIPAVPPAAVLATTGSAKTGSATMLADAVSTSAPVPTSTWFGGRRNRDTAANVPPQTAPQIAPQAAQQAAAPTWAADPETSLPPAETVASQRLPIFDSVESDWFRHGAPLSAAAAGGGGSPVAAWKSSPADEGFRRAAETAASPSTNSVTGAGLPKRTQGANLVPGSVTPRAKASQGDGQASPPPALPVRSAESVRTRMTGFQLRGRAGRTEGQQDGSADGS